MSYPCEDSFVPAESFCKLYGTSQCPLTSSNVRSCPLDEKEKDEVQQNGWMSGIMFFG